MIGSIVGGIIGSRFELSPAKTKDFELFTPESHITDDTIMSLAVCYALLTYRFSDSEDLRHLTVKYMQQYGHSHPHAGYSESFSAWLAEDDPQPYDSWDNGAAIRANACGYAANSIKKAVLFSHMVTRASHNHPQEFTDAEITAVAVFLAHTGASKTQIQAYFANNYYAKENTFLFCYGYGFKDANQSSVPAALEAFYESSSFENAVRNAITTHGDVRKIAAITGAVAGAYYGVPEGIRKTAVTFLDPKLKNTLDKFEYHFK